MYNNFINNFILSKNYKNNFLTDHRLYFIRGSQLLTNENESLLVKPVNCSDLRYMSTEQKKFIKKNIDILPYSNKENDIKYRAGEYGLYFGVFYTSLLNILNCEELFQDNKHNGEKKCYDWSPYNYIYDGITLLTNLKKDINNYGLSIENLIYFNEDMNISFGKIMDNSIVMKENIPVFIDKIKSILLNKNYKSNTISELIITFPFKNNINYGLIGIDRYLSHRNIFS